MPIAIKDTAPVAGMPFTMGSDLFGDFVPDHDAYVVRRIRDAGFVIVGKTNMPEFGILPGDRAAPLRPRPQPLGHRPHARAAPPAAPRPRWRRAWSRSRTAATAAARSASPRPAAAWSASSPAAAAISRGPDQGDDFLVQDGVLTRTVAETAALLDVLAGYETGDATWAPPPPEPFAQAARREPGRLRIGCTTTAPIEAALDPSASAP